MTAADRVFEYEPLPYEATMPAMLAAVSADYGAGDFVVSLRGDGAVERITYAEADIRSADMAARLLAAGVTKGVRIGILAPNGPDFVVAFLAATRIGAVAVPINTLFQPAELHWVLRDADIHTLLAVETLLDKDVLDRIEAAADGWSSTDGQLRIPRLPQLRNVFPLGQAVHDWPSTWPEPVEPSFLKACEATVRAADDLLVIYTSGSTSNPKGIIHTHGTAITHSRFIATAHDWNHDDRIYVPMVFFWVAGLVFGLLGPMQVGATLLTEHKFDAGLVLRLLETEKATYTTGFPHIGPALTNHPDFASTDLSSLREGYQQVLLPPEKRTADPSLRVAQLGMTETCSSHTWWPPHEELPEAKRGSLGVSAPEYEHKIVDDDGNEVPNGVTGEICVRGTALLRGMVGKQWHEVVDRDGWLHTKDAGYRDDDGHLYFAGRTDDMIKTSGTNVAPMEVEAALGRIDAVRIAYVVGVPDPDKGAIVSAAVVLNEGRSVSADDLVTACRSQIAAYKVPKKWVILPDPNGLPYTTTNKIDKTRLTALMATGELS
ncbi:acyl-CoA synthetase [Mycolicibacterium moriokaense]|jgi:acyl-CoA synthetase (AMP-forming)/AMP-acid ligase II|uniref:AMP-binding protein n=1 Tax=Mycolicibacterium moriokaense TaxID=39691 RepID=A0AAD1HA43_9MYCO|nr:class I adenylate-forming enzyme family protein [Mycolicibacterium moriokaense]MCV7043042.1 acyl--CoA ligase [Mycolicibacterium moriokaense]ORB18006.1 acyl-CoA synthetase [Mycolicibacterium moriokaense]BBX00951.1 AMP-binding protein [Mycolicibacterium moriokaense]